MVKSSSMHPPLPDSFMGSLTQLLLLLATATTSLAQNCLVDDFFTSTINRRNPDTSTFFLVITAPLGCRPTPTSPRIDEAIRPSSLPVNSVPRITQPNPDVNITVPLNSFPHCIAFTVTLGNETRTLIRGIDLSGNEAILRAGRFSITYTLGGDTATFNPPNGTTFTSNVQEAINLQICVNSDGAPTLYIECRAVETASVNFQTFDFIAPSFFFLNDVESPAPETIFTGAVFQLYVTSCLVGNEAGTACAQCQIYPQNCNDIVALPAAVQGIIADAALSTEQLCRIRVSPSAYYYYAPWTLPVNGSSSTGRCNSRFSELSVRCNIPSSSVLFDRVIPTLTGLDGDTWATDLQTTTSFTELDIFYVELVVSFTGFTGVESMKVVMFNCPAWEISAESITVLAASGINEERERLGSFLVTNTSCDSLVTICIDQSTSQPIIALQFIMPHGSRWVHIAELEFSSGACRSSSAPRVKDSESELVISPGDNEFSLTDVIITAVVTAIVTALLATLIFLLMLISVWKCWRVKNPDQAATGEQVYEQVDEGSQPEAVS